MHYNIDVPILFLFLRILFHYVQQQYYLIVYMTADKYQQNRNLVEQEEYVLQPLFPKILQHVLIDILHLFLEMFLEKIHSYFL